MSAAALRSRDRAVRTMRTAAVLMLLLGLTLTGALAGVFARPSSPSADGSTASAGGRSGAARPANPVLVVVHQPARSEAGTGVTAAAPASAVPAPAPAPAPVPAVTAPPAPVEPAASSSGSDPG